ncbi:hypothetical protein OQJ18_10155 [Fluoribacter dumoffii]|uniref:Uncharacterized protein n=1 Tax=Fluoribacter dumoffii TaxID=463 RepID=A0A377G6F2_9GAMM|nr:hypothetical protein [Fluoribacter dumoffii]KTC92378.1 hypothetical protein Ldum_0184 [Fluoribacter dumoffii NY 23]MCW8386956.1 hypothetical protein [Fluoribacter dumoffii]MCW8417541.1 hypothetical protein [Fluoribacter dumoffii]MCW8454617.1 hypothetical protein [Fluoribacter dumoffii]MCW8461306.1 hypothetical protein [Fluoribacter dumoffii]
MFFKREVNPNVTPQELNHAMLNAKAQRELLERQMKDGSVPKTVAQDEMRRLSSLVTAYGENLITALETQPAKFTP